MDCPGTASEVSDSRDGLCGNLVLVSVAGEGQARYGYYMSAHRSSFLWPREEDRTRAGSPSFSQREVSIDGLACEPFQVPAGLRPCL